MNKKTDEHAPDLDSNLYRVRTLPLLSSDEECALARRLRTGDEEALRKLVEHNTRLVIRMAASYVRESGVDLDDLIQDGVIGLMNAARHFDPDLLNPKNGRPFRFTTYATWWIRQAILRRLPDYQHFTRLPVYINTAISSLVRTTGRLTTELGREPTSEELAVALQKRVDEVEQLRIWHQPAISLDAPIDDDMARDNTLADVLVAPESSEAVESAENSELTILIEQALSTLPHREREVLRLRFGIGGGEPQTLEQVARVFGLTRERIRQIEVKALRKVKPHLRVLHWQWMEEAS